MGQFFSQSFQLIGLGLDLQMSLNFFATFAALRERMQFFD
jgi:hypothetical protein